MSKRNRTIALQAVGVAVLAAVIFVAFLRPSQPSDLSGIEAQGGQDPPTAASPPSASGNENHRKGHQAGGRRGGGNAGGGSGSGSDGQGSGIDSGSDSLDGDSPTDSQYGDLVTRLLARVESPEALAEFDRAP